MWSYCDQTVKGPHFSGCLMLCPLCVLTYVVKNAFQSKPVVNSTLVYFNPTFCLFAFNHRSGLCDLVYNCLFILFQKQQPVRPNCTLVLHFFEVLFCALAFGYIWNTFFLVFRSTEGKKRQKAYNKTETLYELTLLRLLHSFLFPVSSLMHILLSTQQQYFGVISENSQILFEEILSDVGRMLCFSIWCVF